MMPFSIQKSHKKAFINPASSSDHYYYYYYYILCVSIHSPSFISTGKKHLSTHPTSEAFLLELLYKYAVKMD